MVVQKKCASVIDFQEVVECGEGCGVLFCESRKNHQRHLYSNYNHLVAYRHSINIPFIDVEGIIEYP